MGCCILGALIICRCLGAFQAVRRFVTRLGVIGSELPKIVSSGGEAIVGLAGVGLRTRSAEWTFTISLALAATYIAWQHAEHLRVYGQWFVQESIDGISQVICKTT